VTTNIEHDYNVYDLVITNKRTAGVVLSIEKDSLKIMNQGGEIENVEVVDVSNKVIQKKNVSTLDHGGNYVSIGDIVKVVEGPNKGLKGIIRYIHQNTMFLHNKEFIETLGIFVEINRNVLILGDDLAHRGMAAPANRRKDVLIGKIVTICRGENKGFEAKVVDSTDKAVRLELFSKSKIISLKRSDIIEKDKIKDEENLVKIEAKTTVPKTPAYHANSPEWGMNTPGGISPEWKAETNVWRAKSPDERL
jgi:transcription elongation factor SPT5